MEFFDFGRNNVYHSASNCVKLQQAVEKGPSAEGLLEAVRKNKSRSTVRGVPRQLGPGTLARLASHQAVLRTLRTAAFLTGLRTGFSSPCLKLILLKKDFSCFDPSTSLRAGRLSMKEIHQ
jgi:hypothetical protein